MRKRSEEDIATSYRNAYVPSVHIQSYMINQAPMNFQAPELGQPGAHTTKASDVYKWGIMKIEMLQRDHIIMVSA